MESLDYYSSQSIFTDPGKFVSLYDNLPTTIPKLCEVAHNIVIDFAFGHIFGVELSLDRTKDIQSRYVEIILQRSQELKKEPITKIRDPKDRVAGSCRDFAILLCSMLRHQKTPARLRCGFEKYFKSGKYEDHWIVEYWNKDETRWVLVDPEVSDVEREKEHVEINQFDIPRNEYLIAGDAWSKCRKGELDPQSFGVSTINIFGPWFVRANVIRDLAALNKDEVLPWEYNEYADKQFNTFEELDQEDLKNIDKIAALINPATNDLFDEIRKLYQSDPSLQLNRIVTSYTPWGIEKVDLEQKVMLNTF